MKQDLLLVWVLVVCVNKLKIQIDIYLSRAGYTLIYRLDYRYAKWFLCSPVI